MASAIYTIGVFGTTESSFFRALTSNKVTHLVDVRYRRGIRGSLYLYGNAKALESKLAELGIDYRHVLELAPPGDLVSAQIKRDVDSKVGVRHREVLSPEFIDGYKKLRLASFDPKPFLSTFPADARIVLLCVERDPLTCHRSMLAESLAKESGLGWSDITP